jgi:hypothetical protein
MPIDDLDLNKATKGRQKDADATRRKIQINNLVMVK